MEGKPLDINDSNGVWLDKSFADARGLKLGDNITFEFEGYEIQKEIKGLGYSPEYVYHSSFYSTVPDFNRIGFAYLSYKAFPSDTVPYNVLNVKFDGTPEDFDDILSYRLGGYYVSFLERSEHSSVNTFSDQISMQKMMTDIFPIVFILVSMLMLLTTMTRIIAHQRTQIGILKANGFKDRSIIFHYLSFGFLLVLAGSLLGLILGPIILPGFIYSVMAHMFILPSWDIAWDISFIYMAVLMVLMALIVSYYAAKSISEEKPSESIKAKPPKFSTSSFVEKFKFWHKLSFNIRWNYRDAKRNKFRGLMTIMGVMGCTALLVCAFGLYDSMNDLMDWEYNYIAHYDSKMVIDDGATPAEIDEVAKDVNGEKLMEKFLEIESSSNKKSGVLMVFNDSDLITPTDDYWNKVEIKDNELALSKKMAENLGVGVGDTIEWHCMDSNKWVKSKIDKIYSIPNAQGLFMSKNKLEELGLEYSPTSIVTSEHVDKNYSAIKSSTTRESRINNWNGLTQAAWYLIFALIIFASILAVIVLYNLGLLSFTELEREIATLKILGFKTGDLRKLLLTQSLWFTTIGFALGLPIGYYILRLMWNLSGDSYYVLPRLTIANVLLSLFITFSWSIIVNLIFSGKIKKLDMVESLKSDE